MKGQEVYQVYVAIKAHFNTKYDYFEFNGKTRNLTEFSYINRNDQYSFAKIAKHYSDEQIIPLILSNIVHDKKVWIGWIANEKEADVIYRKWTKKFSRISQIYQQDLHGIKQLSEERGITIKELFIPAKGNTHPAIIKLYVQGYIEFETLIILNQCLHFTKSYDKKYRDSFWREISTGITQYSPFVKINVDKYKDITNHILLA